MNIYFRVFVCENGHETYVDPYIDVTKLQNEFLLSCATCHSHSMTEIAPILIDYSDYGNLLG